MNEKPTPFSITVPPTTIEDIPITAGEQRILQRLYFIEQRLESIDERIAALEERLAPPPDGTGGIQGLP